MAVVNNGRSPFDVFVELVREMRKHQSDYFNRRDANALPRAKKFERLVDTWLLEFERDKEKMAKYLQGMQEKGGEDVRQNMLDL